MRNLPLGFALVMAGAVLVSRGSEAFGLGFGGDDSGTVAPALGGLTSGKKVSKATGLNSKQATFAQRLAADTGLNPNVIAAWLLAEEPASASHAPNGANNWLNIGAFSSGSWAGGASPVWRDPVTAADATAHWLSGADLGFGRAAAGIRAILRSAGKPARVQIAAIQGSPWASSHYPSLPGIYRSLLSRLRGR